MEKVKIYFCDQKKKCNTSISCGTCCIHTHDKAHAVPLLEYDEATGKHYPPKTSEASGTDTPIKVKCWDCQHFEYKREVNLGRCILRKEKEFTRLRNGRPCKDFEPDGLKIGGQNND